MSFDVNEKQKEEKEEKEENEEEEYGVIPMEISTDDDSHESKLCRKNKNSSAQTNKLQQLQPQQEKQQQKQQEKQQQKQQQLSFKPFLSHQNQIQPQFQNQQRKILEAKR